MSKQVKIKATRGLVVQGKKLKKGDTVTVDKSVAAGVVGTGRAEYVSDQEKK